MTHNDEPRCQHQQLCLTEKHICLSHHTDKVLHICFVGSFVFNGECFCHTLCANCSEPSTMMMAITNFPIQSNPYLVHSSFVVTQQLSWIIPLNLTSDSIITATATEEPITNALSTILTTTDPASTATKIYGILTIHASQLPMNLYRTEAFCSKTNSVTALLLVHMTTSAILHCYSAECKWLLEQQ